MDCDEKKVAFATTIAMQLSKNLSVSEIEDLRCLINQIHCSLGTLLALKYNSKKKNF